MHGAVYDVARSREAWLANEAANLTTVRSMLLSAVMVELAQTAAYKDRPLIGKLVETLVVRISKLPTLDIEGASQLQKRVSELDLAHDHAARLASAIDAKLEGHLGDEKCFVASKNQKLKFCQAWCSENLAQALQDPKLDIQTKVQVTSDFLVLCGCLHPCEQTLKWWLALVLRLHFPSSWPSYRSVFGLLHDFKACVSACQKVCPFATI